MDYIRMLDVRHQWLKYHEKPILRKTIYRTQTFINEIERGNWNLEKLPDQCKWSECKIVSENENKKSHSVLTKRD